MCKNCNCGLGIIAKILVIIGGLNWGLVGIGKILNSLSSWNLVELIFASMPLIEALVYILVGIAAIVLIFPCKGRKMKACCENKNTAVQENIEKHEESTI